MRPQTVTHICTGCGKTAKRNPDRRHWCKCNPSAPYKMMIEKDYRLAHAVVKTFVKAG